MKAPTSWDIVRRPRLTEKATRLREESTARGSGGGAGGSVVVRSLTSTLGSNLTVSGGAPSGNAGAGSGGAWGGGGRIRIESHAAPGNLPPGATYEPLRVSDRGDLVIAEVMYCPAGGPAALAEQGKTMYDKGDYNKALQIFLRLKKEDPSHPLPKEYINKCQDKIVEAEKERRMKKAKEEGSNPSDVFAPTEPAPAWTAPSQRKLNPAKKKTKKAKRKSRTSYSTPAAMYQKEKKPPPLLAQQQALTEAYSNKILEGKAIEIKRSVRVRSEGS